MGYNGILMKYKVDLTPLTEIISKFNDFFPDFRAAGLSFQSGKVSDNFAPAFNARTWIRHIRQGFCRLAEHIFIPIAVKPLLFQGQPAKDNI
jgi:hypothetical protein